MSKWFRIFKMIFAVAQVAFRVYRYMRSRRRY